MTTTAASAMKHLTQRRAIDAAVGNEHLTRQRVERLERVTQAQENKLKAQDVALGNLYSVRNAGLWGRLRWLLTGK